MGKSKLIACIVEGTAERVIIEKLLNANRLVFTRKNLLDEELLRVRNAKRFEEMYLGKSFATKISVYRILDSKTEEFRLRKIYKDKVDVINVITAPEIEILVILNENKYDDYLKYKSRLKPSEYCSQILGMKNVKSKDFVQKYFDDVNALEAVIRDYKRKHKFSKGEYCLADILRRK